MVIVVLDNDETVGSWRDLHSVFTTMRHFAAQASARGIAFPLDVDAFAREAAHGGCVRPHLGKLFDVLVTLRRFGYISHIVMCTAASDEQGWVEFLRRLLEVWYADIYGAGRVHSGGHVYDTVMHRSQLTEWAAANNLPDIEGCFFQKDMAQVRRLCGVPPDTLVVIVDDRVGCVVDTAPVPSTIVRISVDPYRTAMDGVDSAARLLRPLRAVMDTVFVDLRKFSGQLRLSLVRAEKRPSAFTRMPRQDTALLEVVDELAGVLGLRPGLLHGDIDMDAILVEALEDIDVAAAVEEDDAEAAAVVTSLFKQTSSGGRRAVASRRRH